MRTEKQIGDCRLILADCRDVLPSVSGLSLTFTSPPYNLRLNKIELSGMYKRLKHKWVGDVARTSYADDLEENEYMTDQVTILNLLHHSSSKSGSCFYNHKCRWKDGVMLHPIDIVRSSLWRMRQEIIWARNGSLTHNAKMFPPSEERIYWLYKEKFRWNLHKFHWLSVWSVAAAQHKVHPVAFPVDLPSRAILATTREGDLVCDPFMGSGTVGIACMHLHRRFIGIERDERHFYGAVKRLTREMEKGSFGL